MDITIRKTESDDLKVMQKIAKHTIDKNYRSFLGNEGVDWFISGPSDEYLKDNMGNTYVISIDNEIVGFCTLKGNLIDLMMIKHELHRQGIGSKLLAYCENILFNKYQIIKLESFEKNNKANRFYIKNGWTKSILEFDEISGTNKIVFTKQ